MHRTQNSQLKIISYTYNEPLIWYEFVYDTAKLAKEQKLMNTLVSNGYIEEKALMKIVEYLDAVNIDFKSFSDNFYRKYCKGDLESVLKAALIMKKENIHIEITNLIIPGLNDSNDEIRQMTKWIKENLGSNIPMHFSRFFPHYKMVDRPPTSIDVMKTAKKIAEEEGLQYVYLGNMPGEDGSTFCHNCKNLLIKRNGYDILKLGLTDENKCSQCGFKIPIIGKINLRKFF